MANPVSTEKVVRHIEVKAYVDNYQSLCESVAALAAQHASSAHETHKPGGESLESSGSVSVDRVQDDTFFRCRSGRLKLRSSGQYHDLIFYRREKDYGPSESFYQSAPTKNPVALRSSLTSAFGLAGRVKKFRRTYRVGRSIIHLDRVAGLGDFIEIKVELDSLQAEEFGQDAVMYVAPVQNQPSSLANIDSLEKSGLPNAKKGTEIVENLMKTLEIDLFQLIDGAYIDLINERGKTID